MLFPRKPSGLGSSRADSYRWDGHISQSHCNAAPSCPIVLIWGPNAVCCWVFGKKSPQKAQAAGDSTVIGYLAHPWLTCSQF